MKNLQLSLHYTQLSGRGFKRNIKTSGRLEDRLAHRRKKKKEKDKWKIRKALLPKKQRPNIPQKRGNQCKRGTTPNPRKPA